MVLCVLKVPMVITMASVYNTHIYTHYLRVPFKCKCPY